MYYINTATEVLYGLEGEVLDHEQYQYSDSIVVFVTDESTRASGYKQEYAIRDICDKESKLFTMDLGPDFNTVEVAKIIDQQHLGSMVILVNNWIEPKTADRIVRRLVQMHKNHRTKVVAAHQKQIAQIFGGRA